MHNLHTIRTQRVRNFGSLRGGASFRFPRPYGFSLALLFAALSLLGSTAYAAPPTHYIPGERLTYDIHVVGAYAGTGTLSVGESRRWKGKNVTPLLGELISKDFWKNVYPVNDKIVSLIGKDNAPVRTEMQIREKNLKRDLIIRFNGKQNKATGTKKRGEGKKRNFKKRVPNKAQDMLSWLFHIRTLDLEEGKKFALVGFSGNFVYDIRIQVKGKEVVWTKLGEKEGFVLKTTITRRGGRKPFKKLATFWIGTDEKRTPLKLAVDFSMGHVEAFLSNISRKATPEEMRAAAADKK